MKLTLFKKSWTEERRQKEIDKQTRILDLAHMKLQHLKSKQWRYAYPIKKTNTGAEQ